MTPLALIPHIGEVLGNIFGGFGSGEVTPFITDEVTVAGGGHVNFCWFPSLNWFVFCRGVDCKQSTTVPDHQLLQEHPLQLGCLQQQHYKGQ
mmetsp:Transcript_36017/g.36265  ORF Transcript_36017/g.36265 Transcript_36017/m.36265 type:complete len:92 (-) Transcript_36017:774-1049(-)